MTYLDVVFRYGAAPGETELRAIDGMREVYGVRRVQFNERERTVRVEFDASRLKADAVANCCDRLAWMCGNRLRWFRQGLSSGHRSGLSDKHWGEGLF